MIADIILQPVEVIRKGEMTFPTILDNTTISGYRNCPTSAYWRTHRKRVPVEKSIHLIAGGAFAKGLEVTRKKFFDEGMPFDYAIAHGAARLVDAYGDYSPPQGYDNKGVLNLVGALGYYFDTWPIDRIITPLRQDSGKHGIEFSFAVPIPGVKHPETGGDLLYCGRFDMFGIHEGTKMLLGEDDKTTSQLGNTWLNRWPLSNQLSGYSWGAQEYGIPIAGFVLRGVSLLKNNYGHADTITYRRAWQLKEFVQNLQATVNDMIRDWQRGYWTKNYDSACASYGGCAYRTLCDSPNPEDWVDQYYVENTFNPLDSRD